MKGQYKTPAGELLKVVIFDEPNKMVYAENKIGTHKWYHENEYSTWESTENVEDEIDEPLEHKPTKKSKKK